MSGETAKRGTQKHLTGSPWFCSVALFILALIPRISDLCAIITPDERRWAERSVNFFQALLASDWACTFQTGHPGVTTMWTGTVGFLAKYWLYGPKLSLPEFLNRIPTRPSITPDYLLFARLPTALLTACAMVLVYLTLRQLFDSQAALMAGIVVALDPFYLAHSRVIHHDALVSMFLALGILAFITFAWKAQSHRGWLILSGIASGLALLSKGSALFVFPFIGLTALSAIWWATRIERKPVGDVLRMWVLSLSIWFVVTAVIFVLLWPAMWVDPFGTVAGMVNQAVEFAEEAHSKGNFFWGQPVDNPGPLFYPVVILFRTTPLSLIGLVLFMTWVAREINALRTRKSAASTETLASFSLFAFVILFTFFMTLGSKKFDRYLLPAFLVIDILAGFAYAKLVQRAVRTAPRWASQLAIPITILVLQGMAALPQHPYYLSAYNILAGGPWLAQRVILVGWGEGLEQAAAYLNAKPNAEKLLVATFYYRDIKTFYVGQAEKLFDDNPTHPVPWLGSDYVVFYINQVQRQIPDPATVAYFRSQQPEYRYERNGIPYVEIYRTPATIPPEILRGAGHLAETP